jgi:hypothetical protein
MEQFFKFGYNNMFIVYLVEIKISKEFVTTIASCTEPLILVKVHQELQVFLTKLMVTIEGINHIYIQQ